MVFIVVSIKLSIPGEAEWDEYLNLERKKIFDLKSQIDITDKKIGEMMLSYGLSQEEIKIVEIFNFYRKK